MKSENDDSRPESEYDLVISRVLDAPRELVFRMFVEPRHLSQWWGPRGFTNPVCELDARPGGKWRNVMRSPEGLEYPTTFTYREIVQPERIVYVYTAGRGPVPSSVTTLTFEDQDGKTLLTIRSVFESAGERDATVQMGHIEGMQQSLDRLVTQLSAQQAA